MNEYIFITVSALIFMLIVTFLVAFVAGLSVK